MYKKKQFSAHPTFLYGILFYLKLLLSPPAEFIKVLKWKIYVSTLSADDQ